jgi:hypothetical protein
MFQRNIFKLDNGLLLFSHGIYPLEPTKSLFKTDVLEGCQAHSVQAEYRFTLAKAQPSRANTSQTVRPSISCRISQEAQVESGATWRFSLWQVP